MRLTVSAAAALLLCLGAADAFVFAPQHAPASGRGAGAPRGAARAQQLVRAQALPLSPWAHVSAPGTVFQMHSSVSDAQETRPGRLGRFKSKIAGALKRLLLGYDADEAEVQLEYEMNMGRVSLDMEQDEEMLADVKLAREAATAIVSGIEDDLLAESVVQLRDPSDMASLSEEEMMASLRRRMAATGTSSSEEDRPAKSSAKASIKKTLAEEEQPALASGDDVERLKRMFSLPASPSSSSALGE